MDDCKFYFAVTGALAGSVLAGISARSCFDDTAAKESWKTPFRQRIVSLFITSCVFGKFVEKEAGIITGRATWGTIAGVVTCIAFMAMLAVQTQAYNSKDLGKDQVAHWKQSATIGCVAASGGLVAFAYFDYLAEKLF